jgi:hemerythrin-like domain-containing protein
VYVPVHFGFDRSEVEPEAREILDRFAGVASRYYPGAHLTVEADAETLLFTALDQNASTRGAVTALRGEHEELRSMLATLVRTLDFPPGARRDEQIAVQLRDLVDLVRIHVRKEDVLIIAAAQAAEQPHPRRKGNAS